MVEPFPSRRQPGKFVFFDAGGKRLSKPITPAEAQRRRKLIVKVARTGKATATRKVIKRKRRK